MMIHSTLCRPHISCRAEILHASEQGIVIVWLWILQAPRKEIRKTPKKSRAEMAAHPR